MPSVLTGLESAQKLQKLTRVLDISVHSGIRCRSRRRARGSTSTAVTPRRPSLGRSRPFARALGARAGACAAEGMPPRSRGKKRAEPEPPEPESEPEPEPDQSADKEQVRNLVAAAGLKESEADKRVLLENGGP